MAEKQKTPKQEARKAPQIPHIVENIPSVANQISGLASANAPFVFFDSVPFGGATAGVGQIVLTAGRQIGFVLDAGYDHVVVAHLRCTLPTLRILRETIDKVEKMLVEEAAGIPAAVKAPSPSGMAH